MLSQLIRKRYYRTLGTGVIMHFISVRLSVAFAHIFSSFWLDPLSFSLFCCPLVQFFHFEIWVGPIIDVESLDDLSFIVPIIKKTSEEQYHYIIGTDGFNNLCDKQCLRLLEIPFKVWRIILSDWQSRVINLLGQYKEFISLLNLKLSFHNCFENYEYPVD